MCEDERKNQCRCIQIQSTPFQKKLLVSRMLFFAKGTYAFAYESSLGPSTRWRQLPEVEGLRRTWVQQFFWNEQGYILYLIPK